MNVVVVYSLGVEVGCCELVVEVAVVLAYPAGVEVGWAELDVEADVVPGSV